MIDIKTKFNKRDSGEIKRVAYWDKDICGFVQNQNKDKTRILYNIEQIDKMIESGTIVVGEDGLPKVVPRAEPTEEEKNKQKKSQYERRVDELIRSKYTLSQELAILRQQESKSDEYQAYFDYCEECKAKAKAEVYGNEV